MRNKAVVRGLAFSMLAALSPEECADTIQWVFLGFGIRFARMKASWLAWNVSFIRENFRTEVAAGRKALQAHGRNRKMNFLIQFFGIGPKYARNFWMDLHDHDFRDSIAIDSRVRRVLSALGQNSGSYEDKERFLLSIAKEADLEGWELDRLLFHYTDHFLRAIAGRAGLS